MRNPESHSAPVTPNNPESLGKGIEDFHSVWIQKDLMHYMIPEELRPYIVESDGKSLNCNEDELLMAWIAKFGTPFREYWDKCEVSKESDDRYQRAKLFTETNQTLYSDDYKIISASFDSDDVREYLIEAEEILTHKIH
jgi:hypothetical protein